MGKHHKTVRTFPATPAGPHHIAVNLRQHGKVNPVCLLEVSKAKKN